MGDILEHSDVNLPYYEFVDGPFINLHAGDEVIQLEAIGSIAWSYGQIGIIRGFSTNAASAVCADIEFTNQWVQSYHLDWFRDKNLAVLKDPPLGWKDDWFDEFQFEI